MHFSVSNYCRCCSCFATWEIWQLSWVRELIFHENALQVICLVAQCSSFSEIYLLVSLFSLSNLVYQKLYVFCLSALMGFFFSDVQSTPKFSQLSWFYYSTFKGVLRNMWDTTSVSSNFTDDPEDIPICIVSAKNNEIHFFLREKQLQFHRQSAQAGCCTVAGFHSGSITEQLILHNILSAV